ncbi:hypothetical protein Scep_016239 [Stephania cephalantha]|uniref:CASP-like protein n=1 Tax=Stephania cephalantha TaxID=152367 RepID=A0AAP0IM99_9MAGN
MAMPLITNLVLRIVALILLSGAAVIIVTNSAKASVDDAIKFNGSVKTINAYKYGLGTSVFGLIYALVQLPFAIYHVITREPLVLGNELFLTFRFYGDKVVSYLLATGAAAIYGFAVDSKRLIDDLDNLVKKGGRDDLSHLRSKYDRFSIMASLGASLLLLGFICTAVSSVLSSLNLAKKRSGTAEVQLSY